MRCKLEPWWQKKEREVDEDNALIVIEKVRPLLSEATGKVDSMPLASAEEGSMDSSVEGVAGGESTVASAEECSMYSSVEGVAGGESTVASAEECSMDSLVEGVAGGEPTLASAEESSMEPSADVSHGNVCKNTSTDMCDDNGALCDSLDLGNVSKGDDKSKLVKEIQRDISLKYCKKLASMKERGISLKRWVVNTYSC